MPADPVVSPADTIRWLNPHSGAWCDDAASYLRDHIADPRLSDVAEALSALAALLAVGERDSAPEIGPVPTDAGGPGKEETYWLTQKLKASIRHLRDIEDYYRPRSDRLGLYNEQRADRARVLYEQITADFLHGKLLVLPEIVALREAGERDRQHIAQLTEVAEAVRVYIAEPTRENEDALALANLNYQRRAVLADKDDAE